MQPRFYGVTLTPATAAGLVASTGLPSVTFETMCLSRFAGTALDFTGLDVARDASLRPLALREWALFIGSRACSQCLAESNGMWLLWWRLGVAAACPRHRVLLADCCPRCGLRLRRGHASRGGVARRGAVDVLRCGNSGPHVAERAGCSQRLDQIEGRPATVDLLAAQQAVLDAAFGGPTTIAGVPVGAADWFRGLRFAAALHRVFAPVDYVAAYPGMPPVAADAFATAAQTRSSKAALRARNPPNVGHAAADLLLAFRALAAADPDACTQLLMPLAAAEAQLLNTSTDQRRRDQMWTVDCPGILPRLWKAIRRSRHRVFDATVRPVLRTPTAAGLEFRHLPHLIGAEDYRQLVASRLPGCNEVVGRRLTAAACARLLGARSWHAATERLGMPGHAKVVVQNAGLVRRLPEPDAFWAAASAVMDRLAARGPVDYAARRTALASLAELPPTVAERIDARSGVRIVPRQRRHAAAWIWAELTSGDIRDAPAYPAWLPDGQPVRGAAHRLDGAHRRAFVADLPAPAAAELRRYGVGLLARHGISA